MFLHDLCFITGAHRLFMFQTLTNPGPSVAFIALRACSYFPIWALRCTCLLAYLGYLAMLLIPWHPPSISQRHIARDVECGIATKTCMARSISMCLSAVQGNLLEWSWFSCCLVRAWILCLNICWLFPWRSNFSHFFIHMPRIWVASPCLRKVYAL